MSFPAALAASRLATLAISYYISARRQLQAPSGTADSLTALREKCRAAFLASVDYLQVREKDLDARRLAGLVKELARMPERRRSRLLVNERADVACAAGADGLHLPSDSVPVAAVRSGIGKHWIVGVSCHNEQDVADAAAGGADYVLVGPVFETPSKPGARGMGLSGLQSICQRASIPVFALGGVDLTNAAACVAAGASGIAGIRLFQNATDLTEVCRQIRSL